MFPQSYPVTNNICWLDAKSLFCVSWPYLFLYLLIFILLAVSLLKFLENYCKAFFFFFMLFFQIFNQFCMSQFSFFFSSLLRSSSAPFIFPYIRLFHHGSSILSPVFFFLPRLVQHQRFLKHLKHCSCVSMLKITYRSTPSTFSLSDSSLFLSIPPIFLQELCFFSS